MWLIIIIIIIIIIWDFPKQGCSGYSPLGVYLTDYSKNLGNSLDQEQKSGR